MAAAFDDNPALEQLFLASAFSGRLGELQAGWRDTDSSALRHRIPVPGVAAAPGHCDALRTKRLPADLIQAQRDYFGGPDVQMGGRAP